MFSSYECPSQVLRNMFNHDIVSTLGWRKKGICGVSFTTEGHTDHIDCMDASGNYHGNHSLVFGLSPG